MQRGGVDEVCIHLEQQAVPVTVYVTVNLTVHVKRLASILRGEPYWLAVVMKAWRVIEDISSSRSSDESWIACQIRRT